jgi:hypothetical protein
VGLCNMSLMKEGQAQECTDDCVHRWRSFRCVGSFEVGRRSSGRVPR